MFRLVYSILFTLCMPFVFLKLLWRGYKAPEYKERRLERFGFFKAPKLNKPIWVHAVSVGEVLAAEPIVRSLLNDFPDRDIVITTMTPTSSERIDKLFGDDVFHVYAPYDVPFMVQAFLKRIQPEFLIIMETELWPNMIHKARARQCPVVLVNARLSERSARGYRRLNPVIGWMLNGLSLVLCQYDNDAKRFATLGISQDKIHVTGSLKFDIELDPSIKEKASRLRTELSPNKTVWIAASTHAGEDELALQTHKNISKHNPDSLLILVPRHPERFENAVKQAEQMGFNTFRRTEHQKIPQNAQVFVVDTMGELLNFFAVANIAFVGGSLVEVGGHNPIEPGALGIPIVMGPHIFNFEAICAQLEDKKGLVIVEDREGLERQLIEWINDPERAKQVGENAKGVVELGRGAADRVTQFLKRLI